MRNILIMVLDRDRGREFSQQFEEACVKLEDYVAQVEGETKERTMLIELLEQSELFYDAQYSEAKIVANVSPGRQSVRYMLKLSR